MRLYADKNFFTCKICLICEQVFKLITMIVKLNTDNHIEGNGGLATHVETTMKHHLSRFINDVTRIEVHLSDQNSHKETGSDKRCRVEARPTGLDPIAVSQDAENVHLAIEGAAQKMKRALDTALGKRNNKHP